jgi:hypothetical protein
MTQKIVQVDLKAARQKAVETAKAAANQARAKLAEKAIIAKAFASAKKNEAVAGLLEKGIALSERQLAALRNAKKSLS